MTMALTPPAMANDNLHNRHSIAFVSLPEGTSLQPAWRSNQSSLTDTYVSVEPHDGSGAIEGLVISGDQDADGDWILETAFTVFVTSDNHLDELLCIYPWNCHVATL
ncbi:hypothetical protein [Beijerinckia mobilis]|uniref:hypothetical protein n=1 Tax=Beijerinckia mobilis TaxID=231434 RepID=UPI00054F1E9A|nr:hypothetical protein [Beijerinckia mobilis]